MLQYNTGYIILEEGDNPNDANTFPELQGSQKQHIAINEGTASVWLFNDDSTPKWTLATPYAENVGGGIPVTKQPGDTLQFKTFNSEIDTCEVIQPEGGNTILFRDYNHTFNNDRTSITDLFRQSYAIKDKVNIDETVTAYRILAVDTSDPSNKYFTIIGGLGDLNLNPLKSGHNWIGYRLKKNTGNIPISSRYRPKWIITKHVNDRLYYTTIADPNETPTQEEPFANDYVEFLNPFVNYTHVKSDGQPLFSSIAPLEHFNGIDITYNYPVGTMNRGNDIVLFMNVRTSYLVGMQVIYKDFLVYSTTEDLITWTEPVEIPVTELDIIGIALGETDTIFDFAASKIIYLEEAGKPSERYIILGSMQLVDGDGAVDSTNYSCYILMDENFNIEGNLVYAFTSINGLNPPIFGSDLTKHNGNWRTIYYDSEAGPPVYKERIFYREIDDLLNDPVLSNYLINTDYYELPIFIDDGDGENIKDEIVDTPLFFKYLNYNNKLYLAITAQITESFIGSDYYHIGKAQPAVYFGTLVHYGDGISNGNYHWYWNKTNPFISSPANFGLVNTDYSTKYSWCDGGVETMCPLVFENEIYLFIGFSATYQNTINDPFDLSHHTQTTIVKLTDYTKKTLEDIVVDYIETNITTNQTQYSKVIVCNNTSVIAINLLPSVSWNGKEIIIKRLGSGNVNITPYTGDSIDGIVNSIYTLSSSNESVILKSVGNDIKKIN